MTLEPRYTAIEGTPPEPPELIEPEGTAAQAQAEGVEEINRKLDLILQALHVEEE